MLLWDDDKPRRDPRPRGHQTKSSEVHLQNLSISYHMGGCQNYGPCLGPLNTRCRIIPRDPKRDHEFLTTTHSPEALFFPRPSNYP